MIKLSKFMKIFIILILLLILETVIIFMLIEKGKLSNNYKAPLTVVIKSADTVHAFFTKYLLFQRSLLLH